MSLEFKPDVFLHGDNGDRSVQLASLVPTELQLGDPCTIGGPNSRIIAFPRDGHRVCRSASLDNCALCMDNGEAKKVDCQSPITEPPAQII